MTFVKLNQLDREISERAFPHLVKKLRSMFFALGLLCWSCLIKR